jgi:hypothetical protein
VGAQAVDQQSCRYGECGIAADANQEAPAKACTCATCNMPQSKIVTHQRSRVRNDFYAAKLFQNMCE